jgi:hypothetical protein
MIIVDQNLPVEEKAKLYGKIADQFNSLISHPGWAAFEAYLKLDSDAAFADMTKARSGDAALVAMTAFTTIERIRKLAPAIAKEALAGFDMLRPKS